MAHHTQCVARGNTHARIFPDLGSYHASFDQAMHSAVRLMQSGAHMVELEGVGWTAETVRFLVERARLGSTRLIGSLELSTAE